MDLDRIVKEYLVFEIGETSEITTSQSASTTPTIVLSSSEAQQCEINQFVLLSHTNEGSFVITGVAVLLSEQADTKLKNCLGTAMILSKSLADLGDVTMIMGD